MNRTDIKKIWFTDDAVWLQANDGRQASECLSNYTRLKDANKKQLENYSLSYYGIHWPEIDEDLSFDGFFQNTSYLSAK